MTNVVVFDERRASEICDATMARILHDNALMTSSSMDEAYEACKKYFNLTKAKFLKYADYCQAILADDGTSKRVLTEWELDMVAGGSFWSWVCNAANKVKNAVKNAWDSGWLKGAVIGTAAAVVLTTSLIAATAIPALGVYTELLASELTVSYAFTGSAGIIAASGVVGAGAGGVIGWAVKQL